MKDFKGLIEVILFYLDWIGLDCCLSLFFFFFFCITVIIMILFWEKQIIYIHSFHLVQELSYVLYYYDISINLL